MESDSRELRKAFLLALIGGLRVVWPILSGLLGLTALLGVIVGMVEGWRVYESLYFAFITGLTIGYGDFAPQTSFGRVLSVVIGLCGLLVTALVAAIAVKALSAAMGDRKE